jgi:14-3-3 protein epsilon
VGVFPAPVPFLGARHEDKRSLIAGYKKQIEKELEDICADILKVIEDKLVPTSTSEEGKVFYYKMKGDYHR